MTLFGARSIDPGERELLEQRGIEVIDMRMIDEQGATVPIKRLIERVAAAGGHLHLSLDVDAMDPASPRRWARPCPAASPIAKRIW